MSPSTLKTIYYSYFNAIVSYCLPFWGNSPHAVKIFRMQKRIVRIMMGLKIGFHVGIYLEGWKFYLLYLNISS